MSAFQALWSSWQSVAVIACILSLAFAGMAYALSTAFRMKKLELWAKDEIYQALASAFIVGAVIIIVGAVASFSCSLANNCSGGQDHMDAAIRIMEKMNESAVTQTKYIFDLSVRVGMITRMGKFYDFTIGPEGLACIVGFCQTAFGFSWYLWQGGSMIADSLDYSFSILFPMISSFLAQEYLLIFIKNALFPSLLGLGVILRTFFFTRRVGGLLIAIALALYTIYPLMYVMLQSYFTFTPTDFYYTAGASPGPTGDASSTYAGYACAAGFLPGGDSAHPFCTGAPGIIVYLIPGLPQAVGNYWDPTFMFKNGCRQGHPEDCQGPGNSCDTSKHVCQGGNGTTTYAGMMTQYTGVLPTVGYLMLPGVFLPLLIMLVTIAFIKVLSPEFGGDVEIAGLTRFI